MFRNLAQQNKMWAWIVAWVRNSPPMRYPELGLICFGSFIMLVGVGAVVPIRMIYARDHGATAAELGLIASSFLLGQFAFQFPGGWASDKWGRKPLLVAGVTIGGLISLLFLLNDHPWYFIILRFIEGAAGGAIAPAANAYVIDAVPAKDRGAAFGWLGSAFSAGFMMGPAIGGLMVDSMGYASPFIFGGVTSLATAAFMWRKMSNPKPGSKPVLPEADPASIAAEAARKSRQVPRHLFIPALLGALILTVASGFGDGLFISIWTLWLNDLNASTSYIGLTFVIFSLPLMLLMPTTGKWADKYSLAPLIAIPAAIISFAYFAYGFMSDLFLIAALGLLEGILIAVMMPALSAYIANLSPENARGRLQGFISTVRTLSAFSSSILVAVLYTMNMSYPFFMLAGVQIVVSIVGGLLVWYIERRTARESRQLVEIAEPIPIETRKSLAAPSLEAAGK